MTNQPLTRHVPPWRQCDRLRRSLDDVDMGVQEMADFLGVSRKTVGNWINGHVSPGKPVLRLWALRCGVPYEWLTDGIEDESNDGLSPTITFKSGVSRGELRPVA